MAITRHPRLWITWLAGSAALAGALAYAMVGPSEKTLFMPGPLSPGHHQLAQACDACHRDPFGGGEVMQEACVDCHGDERRKPSDSHPRAKFTDPRNADRLEKIDALRCVTCHVEHRPEITRAMGVTQAGDFCVFCHADIGEDRPSHADLPFDGCADAGCHNFHDNRALYTKFLLKHLREPEIKAPAAVPARELGEVLDEIMTYPHDRYPVTPLAAGEADAPPAALVDTGIVADWAASAHARIGANCSACHAPAGEDDAPGEWTDRPDHRACASCHATEVERFTAGKHGMRLVHGLSPMTPAMARLPMRAEAAGTELGCTSCHGAHRFDLREAAVDACLGCHEDGHSLAYEGSAHHRLWEREAAGELPPGSGVSCATCHLPRVPYDVSDWLRRTMVDHNQNASLTPNEKMVRAACLHCHSLQLSLDALADPALIARNFRGRPAVRVRSLDMAEADDARHRREIEARAADD